jgi:hypothetical protein
MEGTTFDVLVEDARERQDELLDAKGRDYTRGNPDRLANFKRWAAELDVAPLKVLGIYMGKHMDSVIAFIKSGGQSESEPIAARIDDLHNYLYLLEALIQDENEKPKAVKPKTRRKRR